MVVWIILASLACTAVGFCILQAQKVAAAIWFRSLCASSKFINLNDLPFIWSIAQLAFIVSISFYEDSSCDLSVYNITCTLYLTCILLGTAWIAVFISYRRIVASTVISVFQLGISSSVMAIYGAQRQWISLSFVSVYLIWNSFVMYMGIDALLNHMNPGKQQ